MPRINYSPESNTRLKKSLPLIMVGAGLVILGTVSFFLLFKPGGMADTLVENSTVRSVTPSVVSYPAPELSLNDLDGNLVSLSDYLGSVVLVNNWATWCPPCKEEMPTLQAYYSDHQADGFVLLAIEAGDPLPDVAAYVNDNGLTFPVLLDPTTLALRAFNNDALPSSYVIDPKGTVRLAWTGPISLEKLELYVSPLLED